MRKIAVLILLCVLASPPSFADEAVLRSADPDFVIGKLENMTGADLLTRVISKIAVIDRSGRKLEFTLKALAVIYDTSGRIISLNDIRPGQELQVNYKILADGTREASSIKVLR